MYKQRMNKSPINYFNPFLIIVIMFLSAIMMSCSDNGDSHMDMDTSVKILYTNRLQSNLSSEQLDFVNSHYYAVMTSLGSDLVRENISGPKLILYRSIEGTWTDFTQFDWDHIDSNENMFCHNTSSANTNENDRILTRWNSWLMQPDDMVARDDPDALDHWINYYAVTASATVYEYGYDGLFIDSAAHEISSWLVYDLLPDDYDSAAWRDARYEALEFIKSYLPDKFVMFNGLHSENGSEHSLSLVDGGMWEIFAFNTQTGEYYGFDEWLKVIELAQTYRDDSAINIVSKKEDFTSDVQSRIFVVSSYLLVCNENVYISMVDLSYNEIESLYYYPEYDIQPGKALTDYYVSGNIYVREFGNAVVLVNPSSDQTYRRELTRTYRKLVPAGGGIINSNGQCGEDCEITYESISNAIELPPVSGAILFK